MSSDSIDVDVGLVRRLVANQFPYWADLPIRAVANDGWDNRTFRLGERMSVRVPSALGYGEQVQKEQRWLPVLGPQLPLPIPVPLAVGQPSFEYPMRWSVYQWLEGEISRNAVIHDLAGFATDLARFLVALAKIDSTDGPGPGTHNFHRGGDLRVYDEQTRRALEILDGSIDAAGAREVWEQALDATWTGSPVWFHGDVSDGNLLVTDGTLSAVIDFGTCGVGDPACDLVIAWTMFSGESRDAFTAARAVDDAMWARGRGWAIWKALIVAAGLAGTNSPAGGSSRRVIERVIADHRRTT
ncbi:aminoglycoside phosphotransferase family protein [Glaciihabitans sp. dw_435]|uniref:aminoglycoside phosphotransferase family protein n=1 Tax=Glaciihabitans sp. dw_435 TaxID=2720081 RepID=UPI001BD35477|nr:aminoglycoside phosphotransferase family protein [Glaciihabitans sp. dw_435]